MYSALLCDKSNALCAPGNPSVMGIVSTIIRFLPGSLAALVAFITLKLLAWLPVILQLLVFLLVYLVMAVFLDRALRQYGSEGR